MRKIRVRLYANLVQNGVKTIDEVPKSYQEEVAAELQRRADELDRLVREEAKRQGIIVD